jgi:hypothetical protein
MPMFSPRSASRSDHITYRSQNIGSKKVSNVTSSQNIGSKKVSNVNFETANSDSKKKTSFAIKSWVHISSVTEQGAAKETHTNN